MLKPAAASRSVRGCLLLMLKVLDSAQELGPMNGESLRMVGVFHRSILCARTLQVARSAHQFP